MRMLDYFSKIEKILFATSALFFISLLGYSVRQRQSTREQANLTTPSITYEQKIIEAPSSNSIGSDAAAVIRPSEPFKPVEKKFREVASESEEKPLIVEDKSSEVQEKAIVVLKAEAVSVDGGTRDEQVSPIQSKVDTGLMKDFWIWAGMGVNYTDYSQTVPGFSTVNFGRINAPSQVVRAGFFFDENFALDLAYRNSPGEVSGGSSIKVSNGSYSWKTMSAEILYRPTNFDEKKKSEWLWRLGVQQHQMPFLIPLAANSLSVGKNSMTSLSAGVEYRKFTSKKVRVEAMLRYQQPISSSAEGGTSFDVKPKLNFDGSFGAAYELKPNMFLGAYWSGQCSNFNFDYKDTNGTVFSGTQNLLMTNFDIRLGVEF
jgi:hypothetical protein